MRLDIDESLAYHIVAALEREARNSRKQLEVNRENAALYPDMPSFRDKVAFWTEALATDESRVGAYRAALQKASRRTRR